MVTVTNAALLTAFSTRTSHALGRRGMFWSYSSDLPHLLALYQIKPRSGESLTVKFSIVAAHCTAPELACFLAVQPAALGHPSKPPGEDDEPIHICHLSQYLLSRPKWTKEEEDFVKEHYQKPAAIIAMLGEKHKKLQDRNEVGPSPL